MADKQLIAPYTIVGKVLTWMRSEIIKVNSFVNNVKVVEQSPTVQTVEQLLFPLLETAFPAAHIHGVIIDAVNWFKIGQTVLNSATKEAAKPDLQVVLDGISALQKLKISDPIAYAGLLNFLNVYLTAKYTAEQGTPISVEDSITAVPLVYASEKAALSVTPPSTVPASATPAFSTAIDKQGEAVNTFVDPAKVPFENEEPMQEQATDTVNQAEVTPSNAA